MLSGLVDCVEYVFLFFLEFRTHCAFETVKLLSELIVAQDVLNFISFKLFNWADTTRYLLIDNFFEIFKSIIKLYLLAIDCSLYLIQNTIWLLPNNILCITNFTIKKLLNFLDGNKFTNIIPIFLYQQLQRIGTTTYFCCNLSHNWFSFKIFYYIIINIYIYMEMGNFICFLFFMLFYWRINYYDQCS